ncbi:Mitochondrial import inner membrane translocase subunit tim22 [Stagonosporopsis vannaccii]|nr:Mitochondrial import inner membrane translocase subunit tim22 [Stagonosporopsis vannaccii]
MAFPQNPNGMMAGMNPTAGMSEQEVQMTKMIQASMESCIGKTVMAGVMGGGLGAMFGLFMASMRYDTPMGQPLPTAATSPVAAGAASTPASTSTAPSASSATAPKSAGTPITNAVRAAATSATASTHTLPSSAATSALSASSATASATATAPSVLSPAAPQISDLPLKQQLKHGLRDMYRSSVSSGKNFAKVGAIFSGTECAIEGLRAKNDLYNGVAGGCITGGVLARNAGPQAVAVGCVGFAAFSAAIDAYMRMPEDERSKPIA